MCEMNNRVNAICFKHFRGLPEYTCRLKGKSLAILGGNGKGKSAIVDGVEFLFSGDIKRFRGEGSGNIDIGQAIRHILAEKSPEVTLNIIPSNKTMLRSWNDKENLKSSDKECREYALGHPPVESFILRRSQMLEFIRAQEAKRYQRYIRLLGLDSIDNMQKSFNEAERTAEDKVNGLFAQSNRIKGLFRDVESQWVPEQADDVLAKCNTMIAEFGLSAIDDLKGTSEVLSKLEEKRSPEAKKKIDELSAAVIRLETVLSENFSEWCTSINRTHGELSNMAGESEEVGKANIIKEGLNYFRKNTDLTECPLCEKTLDEGYSRVFERLIEREKNLVKLRELEKKRAQDFDKIVTNGQRILDDIDRWFVDKKLYPGELKQELFSKRKTLGDWLNGVKEVRDKQKYEQVNVPSELAEIRGIQSELHQMLSKRRDELVRPESAKLERTIFFLRQAQSNGAKLIDCENSYKRAEQIRKKAREANEAFSNSREQAIQAVFDKISGRVLGYYHKLHDFNEGIEKAECTSLKLDSTAARAAAGGLRLAVEFLGKSLAFDPQTFLSEGHLDSLGLCLFLATVSLFNPKGSLLVLDDVLTSVDKEHRHRVIELLLEEFADFQLIITTHDEYWFKHLEGSAISRGIQSKWRFEKIAQWTLEYGPESVRYEGTWDWIEEHLTEEEYRKLGGALRLVFEDFLKRVAEKIQLPVKYRRDGKYTSGDFFFRGINHSIREGLLEEDPDAKAEILLDVQRVFGDDDFINFLSHDNPGRIEIQFGQTKDFVSGLKSLISRCEQAGIIKGVS